MHRKISLNCVINSAYLRLVVLTRVFFANRNMVFKCIQDDDFDLLVGSPTFWIYFHCFSWPGAYYNQVISWVDEIHYSFNILMFDIAHKIMDV